ASTHHTHFARCPTFAAISRRPCASMRRNLRTSVTRAMRTSLLMKDATRRWSASRRLGAATLGILGTVAGLAFAPPANAQTWVGGRKTPRLDEIVAIDNTGEWFWPYGPTEDILGDGINTYTTAEQRLDMRSAYAATDAQRFWTRVYVVDKDMVSPGVRLF